ncbi:hypothetical protein ALC57_13860 [Trachymyrmex cornetzi]|uniref:Uncharacterized protein n=1 Tax=Trachymyrmex cornetzi TaxID=471704 RepID=A0A195DLS9_9HYME|nr:hypothetical protein ALC57_13860 [Trachymyrmex cornetzi]
MRRVRLLESGLQVADVLDHPLDHLELRQLPLARHVRHEGAQLGEVSGDLLGLEVASGAADPQAVVQHAAMVGRHSAAHRANHHRLHAGSGGDQRITRPESIDPALGSFLSTLVHEHPAAAGSAHLEIHIMNGGDHRISLWKIAREVRFEAISSRGCLTTMRLAASVEHEGSVKGRRERGALPLLNVRRRQPLAITATTTTKAIYSTLFELQFDKSYFERLNPLRIEYFAQNDRHRDYTRSIHFIKSFIRRRKRKTWECLIENYSVECILASDDCAPAARVVGLSFGVHVRLARVSCGATLPIPGCLQDCNIVSGRGMVDGRERGPLGPYPTIFGTNPRSIWYFSGVLAAEGSTVRDLVGGGGGGGGGGHDGAGIEEYEDRGAAGGIRRQSGAHLSGADSALWRKMTTTTTRTMSGERDTNLSKCLHDMGKIYKEGKWISH